MTTVSTKPGFRQPAPALFDLEDIRRRCSPSDLLRDANAVFRGRKRADCPLCEGNSRGTLAFTERLWHCHRCQAAGSVFDLYSAIYNVDIGNAIRQLAQKTGASTKAREEVLAAQRELERKRAEQLAKQEADRRRRLDVREWLHALEKHYRNTSKKLSELRGKPSAEGETCWENLALLHTARAEAELEYCELSGLEFEQ